MDRTEHKAFSQDKGSYDKRVKEEEYRRVVRLSKASRKRVIGQTEKEKFNR